ncbi:UDP-GlcNAc--UDP-phosphate GlcNAc-1-phosphate transferase [Pedobacter cryoconitis]|uniref:UDP-N-acetylmuramyl pentapeptide phosphotransferase/UDP-N-acetylglucosamine-1-phosphate transferase n=1 Tax=Pedobacter cryoconitis TaxID=188932 RepID=A0A7X0MLZ7_9SPHI|nr:UDP-GlcNAc--UDP-phosphate GlcNAc-1-phosphate transferase [Pedobacter cryoconitis]MBB6502415.1 UDP-N-acetylmuramyl pentapeptide phosphotransferase/UDP-N-acetylglucosamine-1-phosphate transferase [Pedobacter cryoconitis]
MEISLVIILFFVFFAFEICYFKIADKFNIIDQPNHRSSHTDVTLRGGGIIFTLGLMVYPFFFGLEYWCFLLGLAIIAFISFIDDIRPVSNKLRVVFHLAGGALMFYQLGLYHLPYYWIILALILLIGCINAINFMDGINGITGLYALITLSTLLYINLYVIEFTTSNLLITSLISIFVFNFYNFRTKAKCFAGDVGSVGIAFVILFFLLQLIIRTENFNYLLLLLLYGLDTVTTMFFRLIRKENIFDAHRSHFYQYLANERKLSHLIVSSIYGIIQLIINILIVNWMSKSVLMCCMVLIFSGIAFLMLRIYMEGYKRLLGH